MMLGSIRLKCYNSIAGWGEQPKNMVNGVIVSDEEFTQHCRMLQWQQEEDEAMSEFRTTNAAIVNKKLTVNAVKCLECGRIMESRSVHEFVQCSCPNATFVDGGLEYQRYGGADMAKVVPLEARK